MQVFKTVQRYKHTASCQAVSLCDNLIYDMVIFSENNRLKAGWAAPEACCVDAFTCRCFQLLATLNSQYLTTHIEQI